MSVHFGPYVVEGTLPADAVREIQRSTAVKVSLRYRRREPRKLHLSGEPGGDFVAAYRAAMAAIGVCLDQSWFHYFLQRMCQNNCLDLHEIHMQTSSSCFA